MLVIHVWITNPGLVLSLVVDLGRVGTGVRVDSTSSLGPFIAQ